MVVQVAILGTGIGQQHLDAYLKMPELFNVCMIVDQDQERANTLSDQAMCRAVTDIDSAVGDPSVDLIDICLPPHLHVPVALDSINNGKHVICEKPVATSLSDLATIREALASSSARFFPVFQYRWGPSLTKLRHLINLGLTGEPHMASLETHWDRGSDYYSIDWRGTWAGEKGGAVLGHAIHNHDLLTHVMGPVKSVSAITSTRINPIETEDCAAICFEMENGAMATSNITLGHSGNESRLRFVFEHLTATSSTEPYAPGIQPWTFTARNPDNQKKIDKAIKQAPDEMVGFAGLFEAVARDLSGDRGAAVTFADGYASVELVTAIYHAARTGNRVVLPLPEDHSLFEGWQPRE